MVFYVAIVLLLIGTNLRANRSGGRNNNGRNKSDNNDEDDEDKDKKKHVVEFNEGKAENRILSGNDDGGGSGLDFEDMDVADV